MSSRRRASRAFEALVLSLLVTVTAGCGNIFGPDGHRIEELPRNLTAQEMAAITNSNAFGLELWQEVAARDGRANLLLSPLSASMALGKTLNGTAAETLDAMRSTLGFGGLSQEEINASVDEKTRGKIERILEELRPELVMLLLNAIYFDGSWQTRFDPADTRPAPFLGPGRSSAGALHRDLQHHHRSIGRGAVPGAATPGRSLRRV